MRIIVSETAGFCFGVKRAADLIAEQIAQGTKTIYTLGEMIHNDDFNNDLYQKGVKKITVEEIDAVSPEDALLFIRAHGATRQVYELLREKKIPYIDATCPYVFKIIDIVKTESKKDRPFFIILGDENHPEVESICSFIEPDAAGKQNYIVCKDSGAFRDRVFAIPSDESIRKVLLAQTTQNVNEWKICIEIAKKLYTNLTIFDTICSVTEKRQNHAELLSQKVDLMLVIGGNKSSNTKKLAAVSSRHCETIQINNARELPEKILENKNTVGITAGASTPDRIIEEVLNRMSELINEKEITMEEGTSEEAPLNDTMSFAEMLDKSFKTLNTGEKVTGTITSISPAEIHVDLGIKHTGILPTDEVSDDPLFDLHAAFKVGDPITVMVQKFNDAEGTVQVSKKKIDYYQNWENIKKAFEEKETLEGKVADIIKGGILVNWKGTKIFVPATHTGVAKNDDMNTLKGQTVRFKLIDLDETKKRTVGSIRVVLKEERKQAEEVFWNEIEIGKVYTGAVKSLTSYGAFVDLGGVDGMVHITELSWQRLKHPSEVVSVGQEITVFVKDLDMEKKRISLGYKTEESNPWILFNNQYQAEDVVTVKIVSMMPFGAFAQIIPGIDGLIHISQIADKKIGKPSDVLQIGEEVDVKIIEINPETKKISLSIRALIEAREKGEEEQIAELPEVQSEVESEEQQ